MGMQHLPHGLTPADTATEVKTIEEDVSDFRHFAELSLKAAPTFLAGKIYANLCDLAAEHDVYLTGCEDAQNIMDDWNELSAVDADCLPNLSAAIRANA